MDSEKIISAFIKLAQKNSVDSWAEGRKYNLDVVKKLGIGYCTQDTYEEITKQFGVKKLREIGIVKNNKYLFVNKIIIPIGENHFSCKPSTVSIAGATKEPFVIDGAEPVIICEGETDAIALYHIYPEQKIIALRGATSQQPLTALEENKVWLCFDNDEAGVKAEQSAVLKLYGKEVKKVKFSEVKDIDDLFRENQETTKEFIELVELKVPKRKPKAVSSVVSFEGVGEGNRNNTCFELAKSYRNKGWGQEETKVLLEGWNTKNIPPLSEEEIKAVVQSCYTKPKKEYNPQPPTEKLEPINEKKLQLLKDPMLLHRLVLDGLDGVIVGEDVARKTVFLCAMGSLVSNAARTSYNLMVNSESGSGKDHLVDNVLKVLPNNKILKRTRITPTVLNYWHNSKFEPNWTWDGKVLYLEDCSNAIFNSEVFKVFTSGGSYATIVKDQMAIDIEIKGKPVVIITSASADPHPEMVRRFVVINLNETKEQTINVMKKWANHAQNGYIPNIENDYKEALKYLVPCNVKIPWAEKVFGNFPNSHLIMRTHLTRFFDFAKASAVLHQFNREKDKEGYLVADGQDYNNAREMILATSSNNQMVSLTNSQKEILTLMKQLGKNIKGEGLNEYECGWSLAELVGKIFVLSRSNLWLNLTRLVKLGFLEQESTKDEYTRKPYSTFYYTEQEPLKVPTWKQVTETDTKQI